MPEALDDASLLKRLDNAIEDGGRLLIVVRCGAIA